MALTLPSPGNVHRAAVAACVSARLRARLRVRRHQAGREAKNGPKAKGDRKLKRRLFNGNGHFHHSLLELLLLRAVHPTQRMGLIKQRPSGSSARVPPALSMLQRHSSLPSPVGCQRHVRTGRRVRDDPAPRALIQLSLAWVSATVLGTVRRGLMTPKVAIF
jgi:hypothetical protein